MTSFEVKLLKALKRKREAQGMSIRALSSVVGVSFSTLARIERGEGQPDNNSKIRLLEWLGTDADDVGLGLENVAFVHFRAGKNIRSSTVRALLHAADCLRKSLASKSNSHSRPDSDEQGPVPVSLSKEELEAIAERFRSDLGLSCDSAVDSLRIEVQNVRVMPLSEARSLERSVSKQLQLGSSDWSAMTVPLDPLNDHWAVLLNDRHNVERQRATLLEEYWHILLGHKLTKIARVAESYGRTYDKVEEHDAYYLAAATLLPKGAMHDAVSRHISSEAIARTFGTSAELVDYRIKRLGLWREHTSKQIKLKQD